MFQVWNPADYKKNSAQQQKWAQELIGKLRLRGDESVLDIGCGDGKVTAELARHLPRGSIIGLDSSREMVGFAVEAFSRSAHPNLSFVVGDASRLEFDQQFDVIFSNATLHWIFDHAPVLAGIHLALKPSGRMLAQMGGKGCADDVRGTLEVMMKSPRWKDFFQDFTFHHGFHGPDEYRQWLTSAGLTPIRVDHFPKDMTHPGREGLAGWLRTTWMPFIHAVPAADRDQFVTELVDRFVEAYPVDSAGLAHVKMVRLEVEATKPAS